MSRGPGALQTWIMEALRDSDAAMSAADIRDGWMFETWTGDEREDHEWKPSRSIRMSVGRALRSLAAAGHIKRDKSGDWYPVKEWHGRDKKERDRAETAYHEAGHAVIGLAGELPVSFVTIVPSKYALGHVQTRYQNTGVGWVEDRWIDHDAFGNTRKRHKYTVAEHHAGIHCDIAGPMAEAELRGDPTQWRKHASPADMTLARNSRRQLGKVAKEWPEYERETLVLVRKFWSMIEAVAKALLDRGTLSGGDVDDICRRIARKHHKQGVV
jgi:hypothetical protein